ncbi:MAG: LPP20 family lipoprotein [Candidatus Cloacimonetes bacterium]|nr:LPP20 family lipoprotein [Candidatus Cloacimonadota bacterium]
MKGTRIIVIGFILLAMLLVGCGGAKASTEKSDVQKVYSPDWWESQDPSADYLYFYGAATKVSEKAARTSAKTEAFSNAAQYVKAYVKDMMSDFVQESGSDNPRVLEFTERVTKVVSDAKFANAVPTKSEVIVVKENGQDRYKVFTQLAVPKDTVNKEMNSAIHNEEAMYNEFKATQAFQKLDAELAGQK